MSLSDEVQLWFLGPVIQQLNGLAGQVQNNTEAIKQMSDVLDAVKTSLDAVAADEVANAAAIAKAVALIQQLQAEVAAGSIAPNDPRWAQVTDELTQVHANLGGDVAALQKAAP